MKKQRLQDSAYCSPSGSLLPPVFPAPTQQPLNPMPTHGQQSRFDSAGINSLPTQLGNRQNFDPRWIANFVARSSTPTGLYTNGNNKPLLPSKVSGLAPLRSKGGTLSTASMHDALRVQRGKGE